MSDRKASVPQGRSYLEIGEHWDGQDLGERWDETAPADFEVELRSERWYYPLERSLSERIARLAEARGVSTETLINLWIQEKLAQTES